MKWQDTVLTDEKIWSIYEEQINRIMNGDLSEEGNVPVGRRMCKKQAETSFKAGIKEVVDWIKERACSAPNDNLYLFLGKEWQAKLKEWGLDAL